MKRDLGMVRDILLTCEDSEDRYFEIGELEWTDHDMREKRLRSKLDASRLYHIDLMTQGGLLRQSMSEHADDVYFEVTWTGFEYLDAVRDPGIWEATKAKAKEAGTSFSFEIAKSVARALVAQQIKKATGLEI